MILGMFIGKKLENNKKAVEEFEFFQSYKTGADNFEYAYLTVIVNVKDYNVDEMLIKIRDRYYELNGEPDILEIKLYNGKKEWETYNCYAVQTFSKEQE